MTYISNSKVVYHRSYCARIAYHNSAVVVVESKPRWHGSIARNTQVYNVRETNRLLVLSCGRSGPDQ